MHASELADPTPYLDGGELPLSVGMWLDPAVGALNEQAATSVQRLVEFGVVGFGVGVKHAKVPSALVTAADSVWLDAAGTVQHAARPAQSATRPGWPPSWTPAGIPELGYRR